MFYESYGIGGWLVGARCWPPASLSPVLVRQRADVGTARCRPSWNCSVLATIGTGSGLAVILGLVLAVTTVIGAETALGLAFDPRYKDFPFAALTMAVVPFAMLSLLNRPKGGRSADRRGDLCRVAWSPPSIPASTKARTTGSRCGPARFMCCSALRCGGRGPRKSQNKQADRKAGQRRHCTTRCRSPRRSGRASAARSMAGSECSVAMTSAVMPKTEL